jgi:hypothetical protein
MNKNSTCKNFTRTGIIMTIMVTIALLWAGWQWLHRYDWPRPVTDKERHANSIKAFKNLHLIHAAQDKYIQTDWDNDGQKVYSRYMAHLWTTLTQESDPILIELIPKKLAFAMGAGRALEGYYYKDLPQRTLDAQGNTRKNDYTKEWAVAAIAATDTQTDRRVFLTDNSGKILTKYTNETPKIWPHDPPANGWKTITDME